MSLEFIDTPDAFFEVLEKQIRPYYEKHKKFSLDLETYSLFDPENDDLYKIPKPIRIPGRWVCSVDTKQEFYMEYEGYVATLQLGANPREFDKQWILDIKKLGEKLITENLKDILEDSIIIGHNLKYEISFMVSQFDIWLNKCRDTQLIEQIIISGRKDLVALGECYRRRLDFGWFMAETGMNFDEYETHKKEMQSFYWGVNTYPEKNLQYGADDVRFTFFLYEAQESELLKFRKVHRGTKVLNIVRDECNTLTEMALIELRGVTFDVEYQKNVVIPYLEKKSKEAYERAITFFPDFGKVKTRGRGKNKIEYREPINFNSSKQVPEALASIGVIVANAQEDTLKEARRQHPAVEHVLQVKKADYLLSGFGYKLLRFVHEDGKIHPNFKQIGTETGRLSGNKPNMQQIPAKEKLFKEIKSAELFRKAFIGDCYRFMFHSVGEYTNEEGKTFVYSGQVLEKVNQRDECVIIDSDFANIEPRIIAQVSGDEALQLAFKNNVDYHGFTAKNLLGLDEIPKKGTWEREVIGKTGNLALGYLAGDVKTADIMYVETLDQDEPVRWTPEEAKAKKEAYFEAIPQVRACIEDNRIKVLKHFEHFDSLAEFSERRPLYTQFTRTYGRHRSWYLTAKQEGLAKYTVSGDQRLHPLHKFYKTVDEETGETSYYNMWKQAISTIAREAYNYLMQAESANILKHAVRLLGQKMKASGRFNILKEGLVLTVHDELVLNVYKRNQELAEQLLISSMEEAGRVVLLDVPVKAEAASDFNWFGAKA